LDLFGYALYGRRNNGLAPTPLGSMAWWPVTAWTITCWT